MEIEGKGQLLLGVPLNTSSSVYDVILANDSLANVHEEINLLGEGVLEHANVTTVEPNPSNRRGAEALLANLLKIEASKSPVIRRLCKDLPLPGLEVPSTTLGGWQRLPGEVLDPLFLTPLGAGCFQMPQESSLSLGSVGNQYSSSRNLFGRQGSNDYQLKLFFLGKRYLSRPINCKRDFQGVRKLKQTARYRDS